VAGAEALRGEAGQAGKSIAMVRENIIEMHHISAHRNAQMRVNMLNNRPRQCNVVWPL